MLVRVVHAQNPTIIVQTPDSTQAKQRVNMASFNRERVEHALNELLVRIVPEDPNDTDEAANQRFDEAYDLAIETLSAAGDPSIVPDVDHIADLISRRGIPAIERDDR